MARSARQASRPPSKSPSRTGKKSGGKAGFCEAEPTDKTPARSKRPNNPPLLKEVKSLGLAAVGILLLLSVYVDGAAGFVGRFISQILISLLGFGAYILPFAVIGAAVYALFSTERRVPTPGLVKTAVLLWCALALFHIIVTDEPGSFTSVWAYIISLYNNAYFNNGGFFGALLGDLLRSMLGLVGAGVALVAAVLISSMLLTGRSLAAILTYCVGHVRGYFHDLKAEKYDEYEYEDEDEYEVYEEPTPPPRRVVHEVIDQPREREPIAPIRRSTTPELLTIEAKKPNDTNKVLLFNEELPPQEKPAKSNPIFASRRVSYLYGQEVHDEELEPMPEPEHEETKEVSVFLPELPPDRTEKKSGGQAGPCVAEPTEPEPPLQTDFTVKGLDGKSEAEPLFDDEDGDEPAQTTSRLDPLLSYADYEYPSLSLLTKNQSAYSSSESRTQILENSRILEETLKSFKVEARVIEVSVGPTVTRYDLSPGPGVKVATIANLSNDLALSLAAQGIRIEAPVPGKSAVGIEIPNKDPQPVLLREIIEDDSFAKFPSRLAFAVGKDIAGSPVVTDIARMPHLLIAGATGSGKSVCINTLIASLLYKSRPDEVKLLMIDPKVVELSVYNGIPHLLIPVVTDPKKASGALSWAVNEMETRYTLFAEAGTRDLKGYNNWLEEMEAEQEPLPQIVIIIDELADLMMVCKGDVEESICRLAQKARACGIHLIVATQRPSVDVITGLIKANIPSRLAFAVSSGTDSRTVLDMYGAEKLLGKGDMLFLPMGKSKPIRLQGGFVSDKEVEHLVSFLKLQSPVEHTPEMIQNITTPGGMRNDDNVDEFFHEAVDFLLGKGKASTSMLQRQFRIGYNRASRLMEELETRGIVGPEDGVKPRKLLITREEYIVNFQ